MNILLIEDNLIDRMAFLRMIKKEGLESNLEIAESIYSAKELLQQSQYELIVCDLNLPDGTAFDLSSIFNENTFVLLSGFVDAELIEKAQRAGIYKVISKTSDLKQFAVIIDIIKRKLGKKSIENGPSSPQPKNNRYASILGHLNTTFDNNIDYISDIIHSFLNENPKLLRRLRLAAEIDDQQQISKTAHQLKSGYMIMGLKELEELAADIEANLYNKGLELNKRIQTLIDKSNQSYHSLNTALTKLENRI